MGLTTTRYIRWDDPGALKLDGTAGSFYAIAKQYFVQAGWSIAFDDPGNYKIAFRNSQAHGGSGGYVRVHDDGSFTGGGRVASWRTYESMSDIDTGTLQCCDDWIWKAREAGGAQGADAVHRCYVIIADERTIYLGTWVGDDGVNPRGINPTPPDATGTAAVHFNSMAWAGDYMPFYPGDPGFGGCGMTNENPGTTSTTSVPSWLPAKRTAGKPNSGSSMHISRAKDLSPVVTRASIACNEYAGNVQGFGGNQGAVILDNAPVMVLPALIVDDETIRGRMRGLYAPQNDLTTNGGTPMGSEITPYLSGSVLNLVTLAGAPSGTAAGNGRLFVETTKSWDDI